MKKFILGTITGAAIASTVAIAATYTAAPATFKVLVNGKEFTSDPPAMVINDRTYLPLRAIGDALGVPVDWNDELKQAEVGNVANTDPNTSTVKGYSFTQLSVDNFMDGVTSAKVDVTNNTGKTKQSVIITVSFYDENNNRIGSATGAVANEFNNGETVTVQLVSSDNINSYSYARYQIDAEA